MTRQMKRKAVRDFAKAIEKSQKAGVIPPKPVQSKRPFGQRMRDFLSGRKTP